MNFETVIRILIGLLIIAVVSVANILYFHYAFGQSGAFAIALFLLWLLLGSWTSLIALVLGVMVIFDN